MASSTSPGMSETQVLSDQELIALCKGMDLSFDDLQTFLCTKCQECCKWITIQTNLKDVHSQMEFYKFYVQSRGLTMMKVKGRGIFLSVPHTCPHLIQGIGCDIYETRPQSCKQYDGRIDFLLKDKCKWNLLDEILKEDDEDETDSGLQGTSDV